MIEEKRRERFFWDGDEGIDAFVVRHHGPGDHPGTGTPQSAHGGKGGAQSGQRERTGTCYMDAARYLMDNIPENVSAKLVHGAVAGQGPLEGFRLAHAWVEMSGDIVIDPAAGYMGRKEDYYDRGKITDKDVVKYDREEMRIALVRNGNWGPWEDRFLGGPWPIEKSMVSKVVGRLRRMIPRHYGPGPHPGTGTEQDVHGGDGAGDSEDGIDLGRGFKFHFPKTEDNTPYRPSEENTYELSEHRWSKELTVSLLDRLAEKTGIELRGLTFTDNWVELTRAMYSHSPAADEDFILEKALELENEKGDKLFGAYVENTDTIFINNKYGVVVNDEEVYHEIGHYIDKHTTNRSGADDFPAPIPQEYTDTILRFYQTPAVLGEEYAADLFVAYMMGDADYDEYMFLRDIYNRELTSDDRSNMDDMLEDMKDQWEN